MGEQLFLERFVWFDNEARRTRYPNAFKLADRFEVSTKTAQRSIDWFRDRLLALLEYEVSRKWYYYTDPLIFRIVTTALLLGKLLSFCYYSPTTSDCTAHRGSPWRS